MISYWKDNHYELLNVGSGENMTIHEIVKKVIDVSGKKLNIKFDESKPSRNIKLKLDISKAKEKFNWDNKFDMNQVIDEYNKQ